MNEVVKLDVAQPALVRLLREIAHTNNSITDERLDASRELKVRTLQSTYVIHSTQVQLSGWITDYDDII